MAYSHAVANLLAIRKLEQETEALLCALDAVNPDLAYQLRQGHWSSNFGSGPTPARGESQSCR
jgi:hypothetical protein